VGPARDLPSLLLGGREWGTLRPLWTPDQPFEPAYLGYLERKEAVRWLSALPAGAGGSGGLALLRRAAEQAVELELDLVSYVG
jgi:hypothetical protein